MSPKKETRPADSPVADWEVRDYTGDIHRVDGARLTVDGDEYRFMDDTGPVFIALKQTVAHVRRLPPQAEPG